MSTSTKLERIIVEGGVILQYPHPDDVEKLFAVIDKNREHLQRFMAWADGAKIDDTRDFIASSVAGRSAGNKYEWVIWVDGQVAGMVNFHRIDPYLRSTTVGYWLGKEFTGKGIMTKVVTSLAEVAFKELKLHRLEARSAVANTASQRVLERAGFTREGVLRKAVYDSKQWADAYVYGLLEDDRARDGLCVR